MMSVMSNYALLLISMVFALFHFAGQPVGNSLVAKYTDTSGRGLGFGIYFASAFGIGSLASGFSGTAPSPGVVVFPPESTGRGVTGW